MKIKVVKKNTKQDEDKKLNFFEKTEKSIRNAEKRVEQNIVSWISDLREKKNLELLAAQNLIGSVK